MFEKITAEDVLTAISKIDKKNTLRATDYGLWFNRNTYSPAGVISKVFELKGESINRRNFTTDTAQKKLLELGFPIIDTRTDFFTEKDLITFKSLVNRPVYDHTNPVDKNIGDYLYRVSWGRTNQWAQKLKDLGWVIKGHRQWNEQDPKGQRFKKYTWFKVYPKDFQSDLLYFTIGVENNGTLLYKLDIQDNNDFFDRDKKEYFYKERDNRGAVWQTIIIVDLEKLNWDKLAKKTHKYFSEHLNTFYYFSDFFFSKEERLMRLTWNEKNWEIPSGHLWDKKKQGNSNVAYENQYGYGHEEWLFNTRYSIENDQYGYIRGVDHMSSEEEFIRRIVLFTINPKTKERLIIGEIDNVQIIEGNKFEIKRFKPLYKEHFDKMANELKGVGADFEQLIKEPLFPNVKFKLTDLKIYNNPINSRYLKTDKFKRFQPYKINKEIINGIAADIEKSIEFQFESGIASSTGSYKKTTIAKDSIIERKHSAITDQLFKYLIEQMNYDAKQLSVEKSKIGGAIVDVALKEKDGSYVLFEVKTSHVALRNIREALGQIFEYAFLDNKLKIKKLVIVGPAPLHETEEQYLKTLKSIIKVPLEYWEFDSRTFKFNK